MTSRPQFSLRTMAFVTSLVCLAAAASAPLPLPPGRPVEGIGEGHSWSSMGFAIHAQALLRSAACVVFAAMLIAGALARHGAVRHFCLGAALPATIPLARLCVNTGESAWYVLTGARITDAANNLGMFSYFSKNRILVLWICAACCGCVSALYGWFLRLDHGAAALSRRSLATRLVVAAIVAAGLAALLVGLPAPNIQGGFVEWLPIRTTLCAVVPAVLSVSAVEGRGRFRVFSAGALLLTLMPLLFAWGDQMAANYGQWETSFGFVLRLLIVSTWAWALCFGLACVFFHWLFQAGEAKEKNADS